MPVPTEAAFETVRVLGRRLRAGEFTSVELTEYFLQRLEQLGPKYNAVVTIARASALVEAARADADLTAGKDHGPLHGIPYGAKDLLSVRGMPTTWGAAPYKDRVIDEDATVIIRLREAGAILVAKLAMVELAGGFGYRQANATFTGPGLSPWDVKTWAGGSSSGSGSAVGAGLCPFALATETWGSIVTPAGYCGVTGLRPTYGRVSRHGAMALSWTMDKIGLMSRTADDAGLILNVLAGPDPLDPSASARPYSYPATTPARPPFRFATLKGAEAKLQPEIRDNYLASLEVLKELGTLTEIELPDFPYSALASTFISCEMAAAFQGMVTTGDVWELTAPEDGPGAHAALYIPAVDYINALRIRAKVQPALDALLAKFDAVITPALATVSPPLDRDFREYQKGLTAGPIGGAANVAGLPGLTIPNGLGEGGRPTALQLTGRAFEENTLIAIAAKYQEQTNWHTLKPM